jgi:hypothetical protein
MHVAAAERPSNPPGPGYPRANLDPPVPAARIPDVHVTRASSVAVAVAGLVLAAGSASAGGGGGRSTRPAAQASPAPKDATWFPGTGTWYAIRHGHLVVGRVGRTHAPLWRSRGLFPSRFRLGVVAASRQGVAFSYHKWLYVAPRTGAERPVARGEGAVGWTSSGVYTYGGQGNEIRLRSATGNRVTTVAPRPQQHVYDPTTGSLFLVVHGVLTRTHGADTQRIATFRALGLRPDATSMQPLDPRHIELMSPRRLTVLNSNGSTFASIPLAHDQTISSGLAMAPDGESAAFAATAGRTAAHPRSGTETVYLLRARARNATPIHTVHVRFAPCERGADVRWRGRWVLYSNSEGDSARIETNG